MELVLGRRRFDLRAGVVVVATLESALEVGDGDVAAGPPQNRGPAAAITDAERLVAAGADAVEVDVCTAPGRRVANHAPMGSDAIASTIAAMAARLSVPIGVRAADSATATACIESGATVVALPADVVDSCFADTAVLHAIEANGAALMVGKSSRGSEPASVPSAPPTASAGTAGDAAAPEAMPADQLAVQLSDAAAHARDCGLPISRVLVDLSDHARVNAVDPDDPDGRDASSRSRRVARLARVVEAVDRLVREGQLVAVGGWEDSDSECVSALMSLMISRGARVVRSRSPRPVRRVARVVDAMSAATRSTVSRTGDS